MRTKLTAVLTALSLLITPLSPAITIASAAEEAMVISTDGLELIKELEGFSSEAYQSGGQWYIGYGTGCEEADYPDGITQDEAEELLLEALDDMGNTLSAWLEEYEVTPTQAQFDALLSFTYNLGEGWMTEDCSLVDLLTGSSDSWTDIDLVNALGVWCHADGAVNSVLVQRRLREACLFLYEDYTGEYTEAFVSVTLDAGDGTVEQDIVFYERGATLGVLPSAERAGYELAGWQTEDGRLWAEDDIVQEDLAVSALWEAAETAVPLFSDVSEEDWFYSYVQELGQAGVVAGYPDGTFGPYDPVTLGTALALILCSAGYEDQEMTGSHWASGYLELALSLGILEGIGEETLDDSASRLLIAQMAAKTWNLSASQASSPFSDTTDGFVTSLYEAGIVQGSYGADGSLIYQPDSAISRAEITVILSRMLEWQEAANLDETEAEQTEQEEQEQIAYGSYLVDVLEDVPVNSYDADAFYQEDGRIYYESDTVETRTGIDVSVYQGDIDWEAVKNDGIDFAIIRLGFRGYGESGSMNLDRNFTANLEGAIAAGLDVGVYFFSQAITVKEAAEEAEFVLEYLDGYDLTYPVVFDWEVIGTESARTYGLDTETLCACANTFCSMVEEAGYEAMIYLTSYAGYIKYDLSQVMEYDFWFAQYSDTPDFYYDFQMWQYSSTGSVDGISGDVDLNLQLIQKE